MLARLPISLLCLALALALLGLAPASGDASAPPTGKLIATAAQRLGHQPPARVVTWLRRQPDVRDAVVLRDGKTVEIDLANGGETLILPELSRTVGLLPSLRLAGRTPFVHGNANGPAKAQVLEPFASELGLGSSAGDIEAGALSKAGFSVTTAYDTQVTVNALASMSNYNVVYMHTHSGVDTSGRGVLASGEQTTCGSYSNSDGSVVAVGVAGSNTCYLAITSTYITAHMSQFPAHSLLFLNGCALLNSTEFMNALLNQGAGVVLSWDADATAGDDYLAGAAFFNVMANGSTVSSAINTLHANNYGVGTYQGQKATLSYRGDGTITLAEAANGHPGSNPTPTNVPPTATPVPPTSTPNPPTSSPPTSTPTPHPRPTSTPIPPTATPVTPRPQPVLHLQSSLKPGQVQIVQITGAQARASFSVDVSFPNGTHVAGTATADASGTARYSYIQPHSVITRHRDMATVSVQGTDVKLGAQYRIAFGPIDVAASTRTPPPNKRIKIYVHVRPHVPVTVVVKPRGAGAPPARTLAAKTGSNGWKAFGYRVNARERAGATISLQAFARSRRGKVVAAAVNMTVR